MKRLPPRDAIFGQYDLHKRRLGLPAHGPHARV